jgi:ATP-dependent DNA ligase
MLAQRLSEPAEILAKLGGQGAAEYKYDGVRIQAHKTNGARIELVIRLLARVSSQFPDIVDLLAAGLGPAEAIVEGEAVVFDVPPRNCARSARSWSGAASTASPTPCETCRWPCSASNCCASTATT